MSAFKRFFSAGARDADARLERFLTERSFAATDAYVRSSVVVRAIDKATRRLQASTSGSVAGQAWRLISGEWRESDWAARYRLLAVVLLFAAATNVVLTAINGPRPGWFWLILPGLAGVLAATLLAGSRTQTRP